MFRKTGGAHSYVKEHAYVVQYLGWRESQGLYGRQFTDPVVQELGKDSSITSSQQPLNTLNLEVSAKIVKMSQQVIKMPIGANPDMTRRGSSAEKVKFPSIPTKDIAYVAPGGGAHKDLVGLIILGYTPHSSSIATVHVYKAQSVDEARALVGHLQTIIQAPEQRSHLEALERDLVSKGQIRSSGLLNLAIDTTFMGEEVNLYPSSSSATPPHSKDMDHLTLELKNKLGVHHIDHEIETRGRFKKKSKVSRPPTDRVERGDSLSPSAAIALGLFPPKDYESFDRVDAYHHKESSKSSMKESDSFLTPSGFTKLPTTFSSITVPSNHNNAPVNYKIPTSPDVYRLNFSDNVHFSKSNQSASPRHETRSLSLQQPVPGVMEPNGDPIIHSKPVHLSRYLFDGEDPSTVAMETNYQMPTQLSRSLSPHPTEPLAPASPSGYKVHPHRPMYMSRDYRFHSGNHPATDGNYRKPSGSGTINPHSSDARSDIDDAYYQRKQNELPTYHYTWDQRPAAGDSQITTPKKNYKNSGHSPKNVLNGYAYK